MHWQCKVWTNGRGESWPSRSADNSSSSSSSSSSSNESNSNNAIVKVAFIIVVIEIVIVVVVVVIIKILVMVRVIVIVRGLVMLPFAASTVCAAARSLQPAHFSGRFIETLYNRNYILYTV